MIRKGILPVMLVLAVHVSTRAAVTVSISNQDVMRGATVDVPIRIQTLVAADSLIAYQAVVAFDPAVIQAVGASKTATMTQNWADPVAGIKADTIRVVGITTNQPGKRWVGGNDKLVNLNFFVLGDVGAVTTVRIQEIKLFSKTGAITVTSKTNGDITVVTNPATKTVNINLFPGANFISFPVLPNPNTLPEALGTVPVNYIWGSFSGYPKSWQAGRPGNPLQTIDGLHGYWFRLNDTVSKTLTLTGSPVSVTTPIQMVKGPNLISYLPDVQDAIGHAFASMDTNYSYIWTYPASVGSPKSWLRNRPGNPLTSLEPLLAYWVRLSKYSILIYPTSGYQLSKKMDLKVETGKSEVSDIVSTTEWCDFWAWQPEALQPGDTIRAYDHDGILRGDTLVASDGSFILPVAGDDPMTQEDEGATQGEEIVFTLNNKKIDVIGASADYDTTIILGEKAIWINLGSKRVKFEVNNNGINKSKDILNLPKQSYLLGAYPNPFNSRTELKYELINPCHVTLEVHDIRGRFVKCLVDEHQQTGIHSSIWNGIDSHDNSVSSGVYCFIMRIDGHIDYVKGLLLK